MSDDGSRTPKRSSSSRISEPLGAPRGKKSNSFLRGASDDESDDGKRASSSKKSGQEKKKKHKDRRKGDRRR